LSWYLRMDLLVKSGDGVVPPSSAALIMSSTPTVYLL